MNSQSVTTLKVFRGMTQKLAPLAPLLPPGNGQNAVRTAREETRPSGEAGHRTNSQESSPACFAAAGARQGRRRAEPIGVTDQSQGLPVQARAGEHVPHREWPASS